MRVTNGSGRDAEKGISGSVCALACAKRSPATARGRSRPSGHPVVIGQPGRDFTSLIGSLPSSRQRRALPRASLDCGTSCVAPTPGL